MNEREVGLEPKQEAQSALDRLEARRLQLLESGKIVEPDIAGSEAVELLDQLLRQGRVLTREILNNRALRLTKEEVNQLLNEDDATSILPYNWRHYFIETGWGTIVIEGIKEPETLIFPSDLGTQDDFELVCQFENFWKLGSYTSSGLFEGILDPKEQRRILLEYLSQ